MNLRLRFRIHDGLCRPAAGTVRIPALFLLVIAVSVRFASGQDDLAAARQLFTRGSTEQAISKLRQIVADQPENFDARLMLGTALALTEVPGESVEQLRRAIELRPDSAAAYNAMGTVLTRFGQTAGAKKAFETVLALEPESAKAHLNLALVLVQMDDPDGAADHFDQAIALFGDTPESANCRYFRAKLWLQQHRPGEAAKQLEEAVGLRPDFGPAWAELGDARLQLGDSRGSLKAYERAVAIDPANGHAQYQVGAALAKAGQPIEAIPHLQAAAKLDTTDRSTLYHLQRALRAAGRVEEAEEALAKMKRLLADETQASQHGVEASRLNNSGVKLEKAGDVEGAVGQYAAALELDPSVASVRVNYGLALCRLERWDEGLEELREALRMEPGNSRATAAFYSAMEQAARAGKAVPAQQ